MDVGWFGWFGEMDESQQTLNMNEYFRMRLLEEKIQEIFFKYLICCVYY